MNSPNPIGATPPSVHTSTTMRMDEIEVIPVRDHRYAVCFGVACMIHVDPQQWDVIDAAVRAGIAAHTQAGVA